MNAPSLVFLVPGDLDSLTGGYAYDRRIIAGLREAGWQVDVRALGEGFPRPDATTRAHAADTVAGLADGRLVVADGLAFGALPEVVAQHARRLRWVALVHHPLAQETGVGATAQRQLFDSERRALALAGGVIVTSPATARGLAAYGVPASRVHVAEPGTERPAPRATPMPPSLPHPACAGAPGLSLLCVATLTPRKGHAVLIEALAGLQDRAWTLHCVGSETRDPTTTRALRDALAVHGLGERVRLHGERTPAELGAYYEQADLFVLASFHEGYGMVLTEALVHGLPILSTRAGAIPDTVAPTAGLLVPPGDVGALRAALARLLDQPALRATLAAGARAAGACLPDWPQAVARFADALRRIPA